MTSFQCPLTTSIWTFIHIPTLVLWLCRCAAKVLYHVMVRSPVLIIADWLFSHWAQTSCVCLIYSLSLLIVSLIFALAQQILKPKIPRIQTMSAERKPSPKNLELHPSALVRFPLILLEILWVRSAELSWLHTERRRSTATFSWSPKFAWQAKERQGHLLCPPPSSPPWCPKCWYPTLWSWHLYWEP